MSHPLDGAALRVERAIEHYDEVCKRFVSFRETNIDKVFVKDNPGPPQNLTVSFDSSLLVPLALSLPVSDCIHNLRATLDYLVYELAILDSGIVQEKTQFPIEDDPEVFHRRRRNKYLRGLSNDHVRAIELMQPYMQIKWTKTLRSISNPDKHCRLTMLRPQLSRSVILHYMGGGGDFEFTVKGEKMYVKKEQVFSVGFGDSQLPVVETLNRLICSVGQTIDLFKPEFK